jgi:Domain of unknown function (DUF4861)
MRQRTVPPLRPAAFAALIALAFAALLAAAPAAPAVPAGQTVGQAMGPEALGFKKSFVVEIRNPSPLTLENHPVVIDVAAIRESVAWDFNTYMFALFEVKGGEYSLVVSQADDLDKDRYHDEIVIVRTLPASSTTRLVCYWTPERSLPRFITADKTYAREAWEPDGPEAGWESNLAAFKLVRGRIEFYGKLQPGLILKKLPAPETKPQDWGMDVLDAGESAGLGGLVLWDGAARRPLFGAAVPRPAVKILATGPLRSVVKAEYPAVRTAAGEAVLSVLYSTFAECAFSRQDLAVSAKPAGPVAAGPALEKLPGETVAQDKDKGYLAVWGRGAAGAGEIGLAAVFPPAALAGTDETAVDRGLKLRVKPGAKVTYWLAGAWERGLASPGVPAAKNWPRRVEELAARLLVPVTVEFKEK